MNRETTIVVIEDDHHIADLLDAYLRNDGFRVLLHGDGTSGLDRIASDQPALAIVDVGLPGAIDGFEVCRRVRQDHPNTAVLMLTARDTEVDRVLGLELGADDYVTKPFSPRELVARVKAILRRMGGPAAEEPAAITRIGPISVDTERREVTVDGAIVPLATREFDLLAHLVDHHGRVLSRRQLLDGAWGDDWIGDERTVDVHVRQLRRKLGDSFNLVTIWGVGYRLDSAEVTAEGSR